MLAIVTLTVESYRLRNKDLGRFHDNKDEKKLTLGQDFMTGDDFGDIENYVHQNEDKFLGMKKEIESNIEYAEKKNSKDKSNNLM